LEGINYVPGGHDYSFRPNVNIFLGLPFSPRFKSSLSPSRPPSGPTGFFPKGFAFKTVRSPPPILFFSFLSGFPPPLKNEIRGRVFPGATLLAAFLLFFTGRPGLDPTPCLFLASGAYGSVYVPFFSLFPRKRLSPSQPPPRSAPAPRPTGPFFFFFFFFASWSSLLCGVMIVGSPASPLPPHHMSPTFVVCFFFRYLPIVVKPSISRPPLPSAAAVLERPAAMLVFAGSIFLFFGAHLPTVFFLSCDLARARPQRRDLCRALPWVVLPFFPTGRTLPLFPAWGIFSAQLVGFLFFSPAGE